MEKAEKQSQDTRNYWREARLDVQCLTCGNVGAGKISKVGFGGTVPYICPKCGKHGLVDADLEGYKCQFKSL